VAKHVSEELPPYALGTLSAERAAAVAEHLRQCAVCRREEAALGRAMGAVVASVPPVPPPATVWGGLNRRLSTGERFAHFAPRVAELFDLSLDQAQRVLDQVARNEGWEPGPAENIELLPVETGPRHQGALSAFVRIPPGAQFPLHRHQGEETNLVIQGGFRENGEDVWCGDLVVEKSGSRHEQLGLPGVDCIAASVLHGQIELLPPAQPRKRASKR